MAILEIQAGQIVGLDTTTMADQKLMERTDLQRLLKASIEVVAKEVMVIAEEFGSWEDSRRRVDLLGLDREANLVVIELKRTEDGGHMELQALRYAAMTSVMTFEQVVAAHRAYLGCANSEVDTAEAILEFLQWDELDEDSFAQDVRIILVSMDFSKEITTTVLWLNDKGVDIRCIRLTPYKLEDKVLLDVQQIIPLPEAADYQTRVREKERNKSSSTGRRDLTRFTLRMDGTEFAALPKRHALLRLFRHLAAAGVDPTEVARSLGNRNVDRTIRRYSGTVTSAEVLRDLEEHSGSIRGPLHPGRWFYREEELIRYAGDTYVVSTQWGRHTELFLRAAAKAHPTHRIEIEAISVD